MIWRLARGTFLKAFAALFLALPMRDGLAAQKAVSAAARKGVFALMGGFGDHFSYKVRRAEDSIPPMRLAGIADAAAAAKVAPLLEEMLRGSDWIRR